MKKNVRVFLAIAMVICFAVSPASAELPKGHKEFMKNEDYKDAFDQFTAVMEEAKERLSAAEYKALEKENGETIAASVKEDMGSGTSEADAYAAAYWMRNEQVSRELRWDWLRKNAEDVQGFYRLKSDAFEGYMTLEKGDEENEYAAGISVAMKKEPYNSGDFDGLGKLSDGKMTAANGDEDPNAVTVTFDGETAKVVTSKALKESDLFGAGVTIDGEYLREKK
ncbi:MAG: hypothetical protein LBS00_11255 [Synergistaceae bacterium]|jgi:hypothetical protein|nr:hypothetical protein [Synergistaceae bacterium]